MRNVIEKPYFRDVPGHMVGIEIECSYPLVRKLKLEKLLYDCGARFQTDWTDPPPGYKDLEATLMFLPVMRKVQGVRTYYDLKRLCDGLVALSCRAGNACGLHVHIDARHLRSEIEVLAVADRMYSFMGNEGIEMITKHRRNNRFKFHARPGPYRNLINASGGIYAHNLLGRRQNPTKGHNTIEVRVHHGVIKWSEIFPWVELCRLCSKKLLTKEELMINHKWLYAHYLRQRAKHEEQPNVKVGSHAVIGA